MDCYSQQPYDIVVNIWFFHARIRDSCQILRCINFNLTSSFRRDRPEQSLNSSGAATKNAAKFHAFSLMHIQVQEQKSEYFPRQWTNTAQKWRLPNINSWAQFQTCYFRKQSAWNERQSLSILGMRTTCNTTLSFWANYLSGNHGTKATSTHIYIIRSNWYNFKL